MDDGLAERAVLGSNILHLPERQIARFRIPAGVRTILKSNILAIEIHAPALDYERGAGRRVASASINGLHASIAVRCFAAGPRLVVGCRR